MAISRTTAIAPGAKFSMMSNNHGTNNNEIDSGTYEVISTLGSGFFGTVYLAQDQENRKYALKVLKLKEMNANAKVSFLHMLENEVTALRKLKQLHGIERNGDEIRILMKLIPGKSAAAVIRESYLRVRRPLGGWPSSGHIATTTYTSYEGFIETRDKVLKSCATALAKVHAAGLIHNDPNQTNFLYDESTGESTMIDFGLATMGSSFGRIVVDRENFINRFSAPTNENGSKFIAGFVPEYNFLNIKFVELYITPALKYMQEHKIETALTILAYGMFSAATIYGLATSSLLRAFFINAAYSQMKNNFTDVAFTMLSKLRTAYVLHEYDFDKLKASLGVATEKMSDPDKYYICLALKIFTAINVLSKLYYRFDTVTNLASAAHVVIKGETSLASIYNSGEIMQNFAKSPLIFYPGRRLYSLTKDVYDRNTTSERSVIKRCENEAYQGFKRSSAAHIAKP